MSRGRLKFRQADVARALRAIKQAGAAMALEITPDGTIRLTPAEPSPQSTGRPVGRPVAIREVPTL